MINKKLGRERERVGQNEISWAEAEKWVFPLPKYAKQYKNDKKIYIYILSTEACTKTIRVAGNSSRATGTLLRDYGIWISRAK